jgi:hypothetical protein
MKTREPQTDTGSGGSKEPPVTPNQTTFADPPDPRRDVPPPFPPSGR